MSTNTNSPKIKVFLFVRTVWARGDAWPMVRRGFRAQWIARGTGSELYQSRLCETETEAVRLARAYLMSRSELYQDTAEVSS
jgi:hypothetical protein